MKPVTTSGKAGGLKKELLKVPNFGRFPALLEVDPIKLAQQIKIEIAAIASNPASCMLLDDPAIVVLVQRESGVTLRRLDD